MTTNKFFTWLLSLLMFATVATPLSSCDKDDDPVTKDDPAPNEEPTPSTPDDNPTPPPEPIPDADTTTIPDSDTTAITEPDTPAITTEARITDTIIYAATKMTAYNFLYPSKDPYGQPVMLSGAITIGNEIADKHAKGMILYNHYTVFGEDECPSRGELSVQNLIVGTGLITVSADYYGFGVTGDKAQAYCVASTNARASVDALIAAQKLLAEIGYTWDGALFNIGYSQGAQTSIGVLKIVTEEYPDIRFTRTFAGGGPYDIGETYRQLIKAGESSLPVTVVSSLQTFNDVFKLGIDYKDIFLEPLLSDFNDCLNAERYDFDKLDKKMNSYQFADFLSPATLDLESEQSLAFLAAMDKENLCTGWTPRSDEKITMVHNEYDDAVPVANFDKFVDFLRSSGLTITDDETAQEGVFALKGQVPATESMSGHKIYTVQFFSIIMKQLNTELAHIE